MNVRVCKEGEGREREGKEGTYWMAQRTIHVLAPKLAVLKPELLSD